MLDQMRRHSQSFLIYVIFGAIIAVFALNFGPGSGGCGGVGATDYAAKVNGDVIERQQFALLYSRQLDYMRRSARSGGGEFTEEMAQRLGLRGQIIEGLIQQRLLAQQASERGLKVTDADLLAFLEDRYGVDEVGFKDYQAWVGRQFQMSVKRFEEQVRDEIAAERMGNVIRDGISISDDELKQTFAREHDRAMVTFVRFDTSTAGVEQPTEVAIAKLIADDMDAVKERFEKDQFRYRTPKKTRARQIFKALASDADDAAVAKARGALLEIKTQIDGGADFAALASSQSEDLVSKAKGGDMGWLERGKVDPGLTTGTFSLKADEFVKEPIRTPKGLHLVQVTEVEQPARKELADVQDEVAKTILHDRAVDAVAKGAAEEMLAALKEEGATLDTLTISIDEEQKLKDEAKEKGETYVPGKPARKETPWIQASQTSLPLIGSSPELHSAIFNKLTMENPVADQAYKIGRSWFVAALKDREKPDFTKFDDGKEALRTQAIAMKSSKVFEAWVKNLRDSSQVELNPILFAEDNPSS